MVIVVAAAVVVVLFGFGAVGTQHEVGVPEARLSGADHAAVAVPATADADRSHGVERGNTQVLETHHVAERVPARDAMLLFGTVLMLLGVVVLRHEALDRWGARSARESGRARDLVDLGHIVFRQRPAGR